MDWIGLFSAVWCGGKRLRAIATGQGIDQNRERPSRSSHRLRNDVKTAIVFAIDKNPGGHGGAALNRTETLSKLEKCAVSV